VESAAISSVQNRLWEPGDTGFTLRVQKVQLTGVCNRDANSSPFPR